MSACAKVDLRPAVSRLGIIAGGGVLPGKLASACVEQGIELFIVGFEGQTDPGLAAGRRSFWTRLGAAGAVISALKSEGIIDLVLIGAVKRPSFAELCPDFHTAKFFARVGLKALGDNGLLSAVRAELESEGFVIHGVHEFVSDLLAPAGGITKIVPDESYTADIRRGIEVSQALGELDIGQAVIVQQGIVLGVEAIEGTEDLIRRCALLKRAGRAGVLIKTCKPQQDRDLDLPTIGPDTVVQCAEAGLAGIVVHAGHSLIAEMERVVELADARGIFVIGVNPDAYLKMDQSA